LPNNGGYTQPTDAATYNYGWHNPNVRNSGTWATQILPFMEQDPLFRNNLLVGTATNTVPVFLTTAANNGYWQVTVKNYNCPGRGRSGFKSDPASPNYPGVVTDYAINSFINAPPAAYASSATSGGNAFAMGPASPIVGTDGHW